MADYKKVKYQEAVDFCVKCFQGYGFTKEESEKILSGITTRSPRVW